MKRVKISTSPGELRIDRDLEEAAVAGRRSDVRSANNDIVWIPVDPPTDPNRGGWADPTALEPRPFAPVAAAAVAATASTCRHAAPPLELRSADGMSVLRRDPVDPLRLRLSTAFVRGSGIDECWTYLLQIPRMYPHSPPRVTRVTQSTPQQYQIAGASALQPGSPQAAGGHGNEEPPALERIMVTVSPPSSLGSFESSHHEQQRKNEDSAERANFYLTSHEDDDLSRWSEAKFDGWSPISSLMDLLSFLVKLPHERRERWRVARRTKRRQRRLREPEEKKSGVQQRSRQEGQPDGRFRRQVSMTPYDDLGDSINHDGSSGMDDDGIIGRPLQPQAADEEQRDNGNDDMTVSSPHSRSHPQDRPDSAKHALLPPNRFDVGYNRNAVSSITLDESPQIRPYGLLRDQGWINNNSRVQESAPPEASAYQPLQEGVVGWSSSALEERSGFHANDNIMEHGDGAEGDAGAGRLRSFDQSCHGDTDEHMME